MRVKYVGPHEAVICEFGHVARGESLDVPDSVLLGGDFEIVTAEKAPKATDNNKKKEGD